MVKQKQEKMIDSDSIIEVGQPNGKYCYAHLNRAPGTAYRLNGAISDIVLLVAKQKLSMTEIVNNSGFVQMTVRQAVKKAVSLGIFEVEVQVDPYKKYYKFNSGKFHLHSQKALILFGDFVTP